jgi:hypothetical protein
MTILRPLLVACAFALASPAFAQAGGRRARGAGDADAARIQKFRERIRADQKAIVAQNLPLTDAEAKAFWPAYDKCHNDLEGAQRKLNRAILDYVNGESRMTDAHAKQIMRDLLAAESEETKARKSCYDRVAKVLPGKKAARYLQIESKIRALQRFDAAAVIPLVN